MILSTFSRQITETCKKSKLGYRNIKQKMVEIQCDKCNQSHFRTYAHYLKMKKNEFFVVDYCNACWNKVLACRPGIKEKVTAGVRRAYLERGDEIKRKMSAKLKGTKLGDSNPMRRPEVREKVSATRTKMMLNPAERLKYQQGSVDAHARGVYIGTRCGKTKWYDYAHSNGTVYKVQGTWELAFIKWLDQNNIEFECHKGKIPYVDDAGVARNYYPDFYLPASSEYIDVKGDFWYSKSIRKFELLREQHPSIKIQIYRKQNLHTLGINV